MVRLYIGTSVCRARLILMDDSPLSPGRTGLVQLRVQQPVFAVVGAPVLVGSLNVPTVLGGGKILETTHEKYRPVKSARLIPYLSALALENWNEAVLRHVMNRSRRLVRLGEITGHTGIPEDEVRKQVRSLVDSGRLVVCDADTVMLAKTYEALMETVEETLAAFFRADPLRKAASREELRQTIGQATDEAALKSILDGLCGQNRILKVKGGYIPAGFTPGLNASQQKIAELLMAFALKMGILSFSAEFFCIKTYHPLKKQDVQQVLEYLHAQGKLIRLNDGHFLHGDMLMEIMARVKAAIDEKGSIRMSDSMEIFGYGRSNAAAVLEYLDEIGFTRREGNERRLVHNGS